MDNLVIKRKINKIINWISLTAKKTGARGYVIGMSGGLDSSTVAVLIKIAVGKNMLGIIMPCHSNPKDKEHAMLVAKKFDIPVREIDLTPVFDAFLKVLPGGNNIAVANLKARLRMATLYYFANQLNYLVAGSGDKSELSVGYFTKYGDGGVDVLPIGNLYKTQVYEIAKELGIPNEIIEKPPTPGLWKGQTAEGEIGIKYKDLDSILMNINNPKRIKKLNTQTVRKVKEMIKKSEHKRNLPPICKV